MEHVCPKGGATSAHNHFAGCKLTQWRAWRLIGVPYRVQRITNDGRKHLLANVRERDFMGCCGHSCVFCLGNEQGKNRSMVT
ncbi:hypothetical protein Enr13x_21970 [Stieleria neptunia]|uniref:Uncharacterized protein n=1 Tax=Stieleria neptunia TaxID=2527979 RepID=A0A518HNC1_9BACT|nr:hypothetical protein Enr13x_21970 [Stieleria neptunia]